MTRRLSRRGPTVLALPVSGNQDGVKRKLVVPQCGYLFVPDRLCLFGPRAGQRDENVKRHVGE
jgi:hypothetical protein